MKKEIIILIVVIILTLCFWIFFKTGNNTIEENIEVQNTYAENNEVTDNTSEEALQDATMPSEITLYDKEDGYFTVEFNKNANINKYNFEENLENKNGLYKYKDENYTSRLGIDLSEYQSNVDWERVKQAGVEFVILRLGYRGYGKAGRLVLDNKFEEYYHSAIEMGIKVGVYFFSQAINEEEAKQEADLIVSNIKDKNIELPIFFDLEKIKNADGRANELNKEEITRITHAFCNAIKENGYTPGIYGISKSYTTRLNLEEFNDTTKWHAEYSEKPLYPYEFEFWQYTESGTVPGINGNVDIDLWFIK
ncbi:MAG: glycoside hydrolase family 25 protein [Clostridia bacterium]|nr:glycoside hydrolase family 25 protein [Clostridia bacterium]